MASTLMLVRPTEPGVIAEACGGAGVAGGCLAGEAVGGAPVAIAAAVEAGGEPDVPWGPGVGWLVAIRATTTAHTRTAPRATILACGGMRVAVLVRRRLERPTLGR